MTQDKTVEEARERILEKCKDVFSTKNNCACNDCKFWRSHWLTIINLSFDEGMKIGRKELIEEIEELLKEVTGCSNPFCQGYPDKKYLWKELF